MPALQDTENQRKGEYMRVTYEQNLRDRQKKEGGALVTIDIDERPGRGRITIQKLCKGKEIRHATQALKLVVMSTKKGWRP